MTPSTLPMPMLIHFRLVLAVSAAILTTASLSAAQDSPKFRSSVTLVEVSAIVTRDGVPVTDLTAEEVTVFDEDYAQPLVAFEFVDLMTKEGLAQRRDFVLVIDDRHISPRLTKPTREVALAFIRALSPHDRLAIVNTGSRELVQQLSTERAVSEALVSRVSGERIGLQRAMLFESDALVTLEVLRRVAAVLEREGTSERRAVVLVSEGPRVFPQGPGDHDNPALRAAYRALLGETAAANVAIYAIDPRGLEAGGGIRWLTGPLATDARSQSSSGAGAHVALVPSAAENGAASMASRRSGTLGQLSRFTGGVLTVDSNELAKNIPRVIQDSRQYYRLVYAQPEPDGGKPHPATRRIHVKVSRPGVEVRARHQYVPR